MKRIPLEPPELPDLKAKFAGLNAFVTARHGWLTSVPGAAEVTMECLPGSTLPDDLRWLGYKLTEIGETERILATAIIESFAAGADGALEPLTTGSTRPVALTVTHAGIVKVQRYAFTLRDV